MNFTLFRRDREERRGGGVLIAVRNTLSSSLIIHDESIELTWIYISSSSYKSVFGICYRAPDSPQSFSNNLRQSLTAVKSRFPDSPIYLFGDFNYPHISWSLLSASGGSGTNELNQFLDVILDFDLHQSITCPTRGNNTLDLLLTSCPDDIASVTALPGLSDHNLLHISIASPLVKKSPKKQLITNYNKGNFEAINIELAHFFENFQSLHLTYSVNANWELYKTTLINLKNRYIPTILITTDTNNPWFNKHLKSLLNRKKRLYRRAKSINSPEIWEKYYTSSKQYLTEVADAKHKFFSTDLLSMLQSNPNKFWRTLSSKSQPSQIELVNSDGNLVDPDQCASTFNNYFASVFSNISTVITLPEPNLSSQLMSEILITPEGISKLINSLKLSSSAGCDFINSKLLKGTLILSSEILCIIFNQSLRTGEIPDDWKKGQIIPTFKTGNRQMPSNYRPISLTSIPCKLLEHIIATSIMSHLESINFFYAHQHGFRKLLSCETQLAEFTHDVLHEMDNNLQIDAIFLDFAKAFDRVPHNLLLAKLAPLGLPANVITWIKHFLENRKQFTTANNRHSPLVNVGSGVPQGACLSPLLFLIFINDLPNDLLTKLRLFADDCVVYSAIRSPKDSDDLQRDLNTISSWCEKSLMPLNLTKCKLLSFTRKKSLTSFPYKINSVLVDRTPTYKYLGVHMSSSLSWTTHIELICADASRALGYLRRNLKSASPDIKKLAYLTFIRPKLEYASSIWSPSQAYLGNKLEAVQNRAARFISSQYSNNISVSALKQTLSLPLLESRRTIARLCLLHCFFYRPQGRHPLLKPPSRTSSRLNHSRPIARINSRTSAMNNSFFPHSIILWNNLPNDIAACSNRSTFRDKLNLHLT